MVAAWFLIESLSGPSHIRRARGKDERGSCDRLGGPWIRGRFQGLGSGLGGDAQAGLIVCRDRDGGGEENKRSLLNTSQILPQWVPGNGKLYESAGNQKGMEIG